MKPLIAQLRVELLLLSRRGENVLVTLVVPLALLLFFGSVFPTGAGLDFLVPGVLALAVMSTSMVSLGIATAFERAYGVLKRLVGSPLPRSSLLLAKALSVLLLEMVQVALVLGVARVAYGWSPPGSLLLGLGVLALGSFAFAGLGLLLAGALRAEAVLALANGLYLLFVLFGGLVVPLEALPPAVAAVASLLPAAALAELARASLLGLELPLRALLVLGAWAVGAGGLAAVSFRAD